MAGMNSFADYRRLLKKVDGFFSRVAGRYPDEVNCGPGCIDCCRAALTLLPVEIAFLAEAVGRLDTGELAALRENISNLDPKAGLCPAIHRDRCLLYQFRPIICRTQGLVWEAWDEGRPVRGVCPKNFSGVSIEQLPEEVVLNLDTLNTLLVSVNSLFCKNKGLKEDRLSITAILED